MLTSSRSLADRLAWSTPATMVSFAGVHGGAGATTMCLLLAHAITAARGAPALTVDLAGRSRGGLAVLGEAAAQSTAEAIAAVAVKGEGIQQPFGVNEAGVRIIGAPPNGVEELDRTNETVVARIAHAVETGANDAQVAQLARLAVHEDRTWQALRWDNDEVVDAVARVLDHAAPHHGLIAVDLGMIDSSQLAAAVGARSHLHVWVVPARAHSMEIAERRLPLVLFEPAGNEAIAVWQAEERAPSTKRLSALGDRRGCPVVRIPSHGGAEGDWSAKVSQCLPGIEELCGLAR